VPGAEEGAGKASGGSAEELQLDAPKPASTKRAKAASLRPRRRVRDVAEMLDLMELLAPGTPADAQDLKDTIQHLRKFQNHSPMPQVFEELRDGSRIRNQSRLRIALAFGPLPTSIRYRRLVASSPQVRQDQRFIKCWARSSRRIGSQRNHETP
jgi:hypothetical protein